MARYCLHDEARPSFPVGVAVAVGGSSAASGTFPARRRTAGATAAAEGAPSTKRSRLYTAWFTGIRTGNDARCTQLEP